MLESSVGLRYFDDIPMLRQELAVMTRSGIQNMDIDLSPREVLRMYHDGTAPAQAENVKKVLDEFGIRLYMGHAPYHPRMLNDEELSRRRVEEIRCSIPVAGILGIRYLVVHPIFAQYGDPLFGHRDELLRMNIDFYREMVGLGAEYGVAICTENMFCTNEKGKAIHCFCSDARDLNEILDNVPGLSVCLDSGHLFLVDEDIAPTARAFGGRLKALHLHCNDHVRDTHVSPFEIKEINWREFCTALREIGYSGTMNLESHNFFYAMPREMLGAGFTYLNACCRYLAGLVRGE